NQTTTRQARFFSNQSIQQRLPVLICILLLITILTFGWMSYRRVRSSAIEAGEIRLRSLSNQLSNMFAQQAQALVASSRAAASREPLKKFLLSNGRDSTDEVRKIIQSLKRDSTWVYAEIVNKQDEVMLADSSSRTAAPISFQQLRSEGKIDTNRVGKIYRSGDSMYYPIVTAILNGKDISGYLIRWRLMHATKDAINRFTLLLGDSVTLYVGNMDGSLWSDLATPVSFIPAGIDGPREPFAYNRNNGEYFAAVAPVNNTQWLIMTEMSANRITGTAASFLKTAIITGFALLLVGVLLTWLLSRSITTPLKKLNSAAASIAGGDFSKKVSVEGKDEIGQLAVSFNTMVDEIYRSQKDLESKVRERTAQLETSNAELESFSYSVSHDLRAPLRAINGYSIILKEDYAEKLDPEANRVINAIISNATMMGKLIDDLISFSKINKRETHYHTVDMKLMAERCYQELQQGQQSAKVNIEIDDLPSCYGDGSLLKQVWLNLISNAIKYSAKKETPYIRIGYQKEAERVIYFVQDNGVGFEMKYVNKLFGVFQRLHKYEDFEGTGIGLALAKRILKKQGGEIWANAEIGIGAVFYFSLPVHNGKADIK
ncbi:MAG TPA: ATP-binding protein, partial [Chitinophagaceae bacterium]